MDDLKLTAEEAALIRELRTERARKDAKAVTDATFDMDDIKPGMSPEEITRARKAIMKALGVQA